MLLMEGGEGGLRREGSRLKKFGGKGEMMV